MKDTELDTRVRIAVEAARAGGRHLLALFESDLQIETKSSEADLVTRADREAEAIVLEHLRAGLPDDGIVAEESGEVAKTNGPCWYVDPLDGTTNYAHRFPHFSVSLGLFSEQVGLVGVVFDPCRDELFVARRGGGAWLTERGRARRRMTVTRTTELSKSLLATGFGYDRPRGGNVEEFGRLVRQTRGIRRAGSAALDLAYVAAGRLDGFWEYGLAPWDWGAGVVLVEEAGGRVQTVEGGPWTVRGASVCASGPGLERDLPVAIGQ